MRVDVFLRSQEGTRHIWLGDAGCQHRHPVIASSRLGLPMEIAGVELIHLQATVLRRVPESAGYVCARNTGLESIRPEGHTHVVRLAAKDIAIKTCDKDHSCIDGGGAGINDDTVCRQVVVAALAV